MTEFLIGIATVMSIWVADKKNTFSGKDKPIYFPCRVKMNQNDYFLINWLLKGNSYACIWYLSVIHVFNPLPVLLICFCFCAETPWRTGPQFLQVCLKTVCQVAKWTLKQVFLAVIIPVPSCDLSEWVKSSRYLSLLHPF